MKSENKEKERKVYIGVKTSEEKRKGKEKKGKEMGRMLNEREGCRRNEREKEERVKIS